MRSIKTYLEILRKKGLYMCLREAKKAVWPLWFTHSWIIIDQIYEERTSKYLWRRYKDLIVKPLDETQEAKEPMRVVWVCWLQGMENAPEIVKRCLESVKRNMPKYEVRVLTAENMYEYVTLPEYIVRKYKKGIITFTHFSDILRTALLVQHGGIWLDATVLLTDELPAQMTDAPIFFLQKSKLQSMPHMGSSWLLVAQKGNTVLRRVLELLSAYWERENKLRDYYLFHLFFYLAIAQNTQGREAMKAIPYVPNVDAHTLQYTLFEDYDERVWKQTISRSPIHKLTWKFNHNEPLDKSGTFYDYILHHLHV